jgi:hypothetical protein
MLRFMVRIFVGWVEAERPKPIRSGCRSVMMGFAEPVLGLAEGETRGLNPSYVL